MIIDKSSAEHKMLRKLSIHASGLPSSELGFADRAEDKVRQKLRRAGFISFVDLGFGRRWHILPECVSKLKDMGGKV